MNVLVTGGSRGIGYSIASLLSKQGYSPIITGKDQKRLDVAQKTLNCASERIDFSTDDVPQFTKGLLKKYGSIPYLVNCAGISKESLLLRTSPQEIQQVMTVNLMATILMTRGLLPGMIKENKGSIVNISSILATRGHVGSSVYAASKAGIIGFTKSLATEVESKNIRVNCILPGFIKTDMTQHITETTRMGSPQDVAQAVEFCLKSPFLNGAEIVLDGGSSNRLIL